MRELTESEIRLVLCEHDDDTEIVIELDNSDLLYNRVFCYFDAIVTGDSDRVKRSSLFRLDRDAVFYFYWGDGWEYTSDMNGVIRLMSELSKQNEIYRVFIRNFYGGE
jgi:hypothetical protein